MLPELDLDVRLRTGRRRVRQVYVLTGNSDPGTYDGINNFQESALKVSSDLTKILDYFTPWQVTTMDENDFDLGSGGIMLLPDLPGAFPHLAVAAGKVGVLYLLNRDNMGQHTIAAPDNVLEETPIGGCWCGASYFLNNGTAYVVGSGGNTITLFELNTTGPTPTLVRKTMSNPLATGQDPEFFTSVSSHLNQAGTAIIWAISHPQTVNGTVTLYAFNATTMAPLFSTAVGTWPLSMGMPTSCRWSPTAKFISPPATAWSSWVSVPRRPRRLRPAPRCRTTPRPGTS